MAGVATSHLSRTLAAAIRVEGGNDKRKAVLRTGFVVFHQAQASLPRPKNNKALRR